MGNVDEGGLQALMQLGDFGTHLHAQLSVQVGQRFVEQEDLRLTDDSTAQSNTLTLAAGQSLRLTVQQVVNAQNCATRRLISSLGVLRSFRPNAMLSNTVMCGYSA